MVIAYASQQLIEVIASTSPLQQVIVQHKALNDILFQHFRCPHSELHTTIGMNAITNADNHIKVIESNIPFYPPLAFCLNCCKKRNG